MENTKRRTQAEDTQMEGGCSRHVSSANGSCNFSVIKAYQNDKNACFYHSTLIVKHLRYKLNSYDSVDFFFYLEPNSRQGQEANISTNIL